MIIIGDECRYAEKQQTTPEVQFSSAITPENVDELVEDRRKSLGATASYHRSTLERSCNDDRESTHH